MNPRPNDTLLGAGACVAACLLLLAGALWVCPSGACRTPALDATLLAWMHAWRSPASDALAAALTWSGSILLLGPALLLLAAWKLRRAERRAATFVAFAFGGAVAVCQGFKAWVMRPRPDLFEHIGMLPLDPSYPSAHTMQAAAGLLVLALMAPAHRRAGLVALAIVAALAVGATRIYLQVHFPSDVLLGLLAGWVWVAGAHFLLNRPGARPRG